MLYLMYGYRVLAKKILYRDRFKGRLMCSNRLWLKLSCQNLSKLACLDNELV